MSNPEVTHNEDYSDDAGLFAQLVMSQANLALMCLGRMQGPGGEAPPKDLEAARMFIDTLRMLKTKTHGNLDAEEEALLNQTLTTLQFAFVQSTDDNPTPEQPAPQSGTDNKESPAAGAASASSSEEHKPKFSKKY